MVTLTDTGRTLNKIPLYVLHLDVAGRLVVHEQAMIARIAKRYREGKRIKVRIDPGDENVVALA